MILSKESCCQAVRALMDKRDKNEVGLAFYSSKINKGSEYQYFIDFYLTEIKEVNQAIEDIQNIYFDRQLNK